MFLMWPTGAYSSQQGNDNGTPVDRGQQASPIACESPAVNKVITIAAIESKVVSITGKLEKWTSCWIRVLQSHWCGRRH